MVNIETPICLHIPKLRNATPATLAWESVGPHTRYELDLSYDGGPFVPLYSGPGMDHFGIGDGTPGVIWLCIDASMIWRRAEQYAWIDLEDRSTLLYGLSWRKLEANELHWRQVETDDMTWRSVESVESIGREHRSHDMVVDEEAELVQFRIRAFEGSEYSEYLVTEQLPISALIDTEDNIQLYVNQAEPYDLQIDGIDLTFFPENGLTVEYDPAFLELGEYPSPVHTAHVAPVLEEQRAGKALLTFDYPVQEDHEWEGLSALIRFNALQTGATEVNMY